MLCCHHPASEMIGLLIKTRKLHPIVTKTDYNCFMYYRHRLQANIKGWTTEIFHEDCLQMRVHDHRSLLFVSSGALPKVCEHVYSSYSSTIQILQTVASVPKNVGQDYAIIHIRGLFIRFESNWYFWKRSMTLLGFGNPTPNLEDFDWVSTSVSALIVSALGIPPPCPIPHTSKIYRRLASSADVV